MVAEPDLKKCRVRLGGKRWECKLFHKKKKKKKKTPSKSNDHFHIVVSVCVFQHCQAVIRFSVATDLMSYNLTQF